VKQILPKDTCSTLILTIYFETIAIGKLQMNRKTKNYLDYLNLLCYLNRLIRVRFFTHSSFPPKCWAVAGHIVLSMNPFDILIVVILGYSLVRGLFRGLVKEMSSIIGVLGGFYAAYTYYSFPAGLLSNLIKNTAYVNILSFLIIFCSVVILVSVLGVIIKYLLNIAFLGWVDRIFGVGFGFIKGFLIVSVLFISLTAFLPKGSAFIKNSVLAPHVSWVSEKMANVISKEMKRDFMAKLGELKKAWKIPK
jgi:membrane protein required for colicin V production